MTAKHTPGPWTAGKDGKHRAWIADLHNGVGVWTERRFQSGEVYEWGDREADSRLMAAAPEMLAALKALAGPMESVRDDQASLGLRFGSTPTARAERARILIDWIKANADTVDDALEVAFAAIAKAEGAA